MTAAAVRRLVKADARPNNTYSSEVREAVADYARRRRNQGARWREIQDEVGVSATTARKWAAANDGGFHQVVIVDEQPLVPATVPVQTLTITTPSGFVLSGFSLDQAVGLMRDLQ